MLLLDEKNDLKKMRNVVLANNWNKKTSMTIYNTN